jgi:hypothetical protein
MVLLLCAVPGYAQQPAQNVLRYGTDFFSTQRPKTALDMVNWLPGFTLVSGDASVRGFSGAAGNVLRDGERPADKKFTLDQILQRIPADHVDYIELVRGSAANLDMLGQSVVANVVRKASARDSMTLSLADAQFISGHNAPSLTLEGTYHGDRGRQLSGAISLSKYVEASSGHGPQIRRNGGGALVNEKQTTLAAGGTTGFAYGVFETPAWGGKLRLNGNLAWTDYNNRQSERTLSPAPGLSLLREHLGGPLGGQLAGEAGANFKRDFGRLTSENVVLVRLRGQSFSSRLTSPGASPGIDQLFEVQDHTGEAVARSTLRYPFDADLTLEAGIEGAYNWLGTTSSFQFNAMPIALPNARATVSEVREEGSLKAVWNAGDTIQLEGGLRMENSTITSQADVRQSTSLFYPKPRLALTFTPNAQNQFRFRAEREVGQLDFNNYVAASSLDTGAIRAGNTGIVPQQAWVFETAYERRFWDSGSLTLTYRHSLISDAVDRVPIRNPGAATFDAPGNIGAGFMDVFVPALTLPLDRIGLDHTQLKASGTLQWSAVTDPTTGQKRPISLLNARDYSVDFRQDLPEWNAAWGASLATPCFTNVTAKGCTREVYRFNEIDVFHADPALNLFTEYQPWPDTFLRLEADNILGTNYGRLVNIYGGPRDAFALSYGDDRRLRSSPSFKISLRRTL